MTRALTAVIAIVLAFSALAADDLAAKLKPLVQQTANALASSDASAARQLLSTQAGALAATDGKRLVAVTSAREQIVGKLPLLQAAGTVDKVKVTDCLYFADVSAQVTAAGKKWRLDGAALREGDGWRWIVAAFMPASDKPDATLGQAADQAMLGLVNAITLGNLDELRKALFQPAFACGVVGPDYGFYTAPSADAFFELVAEASGQYALHIKPVGERNTVAVGKVAIQRGQWDLGVGDMASIREQIFGVLVATSDGWRALGFAAAPKP